MEDDKIYLITCETDVRDKQGRKTGRVETVVSHGVGNHSLRNYILPCDSLRCFNPKFDGEGAYINT